MNDLAGKSVSQIELHENGRLTKWMSLFRIPALSPNPYIS